MLRFSAGPDHARRHPPALLAPSDRKSGGAVRPARILLVEDDYFVALELESRLSEAGFEVVGIASTAEEALEMAASGMPELAIMDIRLGGPRDGVDAATELLAKLGVPSIFATAHADERQEDVRGGQAARMATKALLVGVAYCARQLDTREK